MRSEHVRLGSIALIACALLGCDEKHARKDLPDWSAGYDTASDASVIDNDASSYGVPAGGFGIEIPNDVEYPHRLYELGREDAPCAVTLGDDAHKDIRCIYDTDEDDLFVLGFEFNIVTPEGGCDFVLYEPYFYESWEIGKGPTEVSYTKNEDGTFSDEVNSQNGKPACEFDHSRDFAFGPNCCYGTYTTTIKSAMTGDTTTEHGVWGGPSADCYDGAAFLRDGATFNRAGFPLDPIWHIDRHHHVIGVKHNGLSDKYPGINYPLADYWNPDDGPTPQALSDLNAREYYRLTCLDDASEVLARITFEVREWNEELQFDTHGNPDTTGTERDFDSMVNDELDWKDLADQHVDFAMTLRPK